MMTRSELENALFENIQGWDPTYINGIPFHYIHLMYGDYAMNMTNGDIKKIGSGRLVTLPAIRRAIERKFF